MADVDSNPGPYHGALEVAARFSMITALALFASFLVWPWQLRFTRTAPFSPQSLVYADLIDLFPALGPYRVCRQLSARTQEGGPERDFLDRIRLSVASLAVTASALLTVTGLNLR